MAAMGAPCKAVIFTESKRTQEYLQRYLAAYHYDGQLLNTVRPEPVEGLQAEGFDRLSPNGIPLTNSAGLIVTFSGTNNSPETTLIYQQWLTEYQGTDKITGSPQIDRRTALIDHFQNHAEIMIATEAGAEGVNLQFCSLLINYDLPWNPQRVFF